MIKAFSIWILVVIGPDQFPRPLAEFTDFKSCNTEQQQYLMMGLSEFKYECQERHRYIFRPPSYGKLNATNTEQSK